MAGNTLVQIDEDELLEELEALKGPSITVVEDGIIEVEGEKMALPSVPEGKLLEEDENEPEKAEKELIAE